MKRAVPFILILSLIFTSVLSLSSCKREYKTRTKTFYEYFDTVSIISSYGDETDEGFEKACEAAENILSFYHKRFDIYFEYSGINNLMTVNKNAGIAPVSVDTEVIDFLEYCKDLFTLTNGETNVMMGSVLKLWHNERSSALDNPTQPESARLPDPDELREAALHTDIDLLVIDRDAGTVYISDPLASIDVGAIGKGYATEKLSEKLRELGCDSYALNIGGNLRTVGVKPDGDKWVTGITNPDPESFDFAARIKLGDTSCVTSGSYERYYTVDGKDYHHIIDRDTLYPSLYYVSVTVITADSGLADALSTALFCMSYEDGLALVKSLDGVEVLWIYESGEQKMTDGFKEIIVEQ